MHPKAYAIVEKESGKIESIWMRREAARLTRKFLHTIRVKNYRIISVEIRKLKK